LAHISGSENCALEEQSFGSTSCGKRPVTVRSSNNVQIAPVFLLGLLDEVGYPTVLKRLGRLEIL